MERLRQRQTHTMHTISQSPPRPVLQHVPLHISLPLHHSNPFLYIDRQARQLQDDLQSLLDAQSAGLTAGLQASSRDDASVSSTAGSSTPTPSQYSTISQQKKKYSLTVPVRQPPQRKVGLKSARRGILRSMHKLLSLKEEEQRIIGSELNGRREVLREVDHFMSKQKGLTKFITEIEHDDSAGRIAELGQQSKELEDDIREMELRLMEMRSRHRQMLSEMSELQNSVDSKLSSYKESLSLLDKDVLRYLKSPPIQPLPASGESTPTFYALNPKRRTLEMANEHWANEQVELRKRKRRVDLDINALKEGGSVWNKTMTVVTEFEKALAGIMQQSMVLLSSPSETAPSGVNKANVAEILAQLDDTTKQLEALLQIAEDKNWNLLICCIGAELEAFRQAKPLLLSILPPGEDEDEDAKERDDNDISDNDVPSEFLAGSPDDDRPVVPPEANAREQSASPVPSFTDKTKSPSPGVVHTQPVGGDEDEPDPAWLLSD